MRAFVDEKFWSDPGVEELGPEEKLSILWLITNSKRDICGFTEISHRRFCFDTGLKVEALQRALQGLGKGFVVPAKGYIWSRNFVAHQLGRGLKLQRNNITKSVVKHLVSLPSEFQELFLEEYPELEALAKGLQSPCQGERKGKGKGTVKKKAKKEIPTVEEVIEEMKIKLPEINNDWTPSRVTKATRLKYETCIENGWRDGFDNPIKVWKTKFVNMLKNEKPWAYGSDKAESSKPPPKTIEGPDGWEDAYRELFPDWGVPDQWGHVAPELRPDIEAKIKNFANV